MLAFVNPFTNVVSDPTVLNIILAVAIAYLLGSLSISVMVSKVMTGVDIRTVGSGNAGSTNALRHLGKKGAIIVLVGDILKAIIATLIGRMLLGEVGAYISGLFCMVGHIYPVFFSFKGGKGVASIIGAMLIINWSVLIVVLIVFFGTLFVFKTVSISSISCMFIAPFATYYFSGGNILFTILMSIVSAIVIIKHKSNIERIFKGTEPKTKFKKEN